MQSSWRLSAWLTWADLPNQIRFADLLDVIITALLLYVFFIWLRERASRSLAIVAAALVSLFLLARWLDLYVTTMVFHYGSVGILLAMVVVFQDDIRHGVEQLAAGQWLRRSANDEPLLVMVDTITEAVVEMANQRIGALIVFPGRQPIGRHLRGGVQVDAKISAPLLLSIFHPKSPGHDGAILVERGLISSLGLHLPLSTNLHKVQNGGTRHTAALGLVERCDAMAIAVSEERGTVTIAIGGELRVVEPQQLAVTLRQYLSGEGVVAEQKNSLRKYDWVTKANLVAKAGAILVASTLWFMFAYPTDTVQRTFAIPIEYRNVPEGLEIESPKPTHVQVTLSGVEPAFTTLDPAAVAVSLNVEQSSGSQVLRWSTASNLKNIPADMKIENVSPDAIVVSLRRKSSG